MVITSIFGIVLNGDEFTRSISKANGNTYAVDVQQNFQGDFKIGSETEW